MNVHEIPLHVVVALTYYYELNVRVENVAVRPDLVYRLAQQVVSLVRNHVRYHAHDGDIGVFGQRQHALQFQLVFRLVLDCVRRVVDEQRRRRRGVVLVHVDAVEYTHYLFAVFNEHAVQPVRILGQSDFARVLRRHGSHLVGGANRALYEVEPVVVLDERQIVFRNTEHVARDYQRIYTLITYVVNGEHVLDIFVARAIFVFERVVYGHERGQVVVRLQHLGLKVEMGQKLQHRFGKEREPLRVVVISVDVCALKVIFVIHEIVYHAAILHAEQSAILIAPSKPDGNIAHKRHFVLVSRCDIFVQRHHYARVRLFGLVKRTGQARTDFADPARRGKRFRLGRYE